MEVDGPKKDVRRNIIIDPDQRKHMSAVALSRLWSAALSFSSGTSCTLCGPWNALLVSFVPVFTGKTREMPQEP